MNYRKDIRSHHSHDSTCAAGHQRAAAASSPEGVDDEDIRDGSMMEQPPGGTVSSVLPTLHDSTSNSSKQLPPSDTSGLRQQLPSVVGSMHPRPDGAALRQQQPPSDGGSTPSVVGWTQPQPDGAGLRQQHQAPSDCGSTKQASKPEGADGLMQQSPPDGGADLTQLLHSAESRTMQMQSGSSTQPAGSWMQQNPTAARGWMQPPISDGHHWHMLHQSLQQQPSAPPHPPYYHQQQPGGYFPQQQNLSSSPHCHPPAAPLYHLSPTAAPFQYHPAGAPSYLPHQQINHGPASPLYHLSPPAQTHQYHHAGAPSYLLPHQQIIPRRQMNHYQRLMQDLEGMKAAQRVEPSANRAEAIARLEVELRFLEEC